MASSHFKRLMMPMLKHLNVDVSSLEVEERSIVKVEFRHMQIQFSAPENQDLLIMASLGQLPESLTREAWPLLQENLAGAASPPVIISAVPDSHNLIIWTQENLLRLDDRSLIALFERLVDKCNRVSLLLSGLAAEQDSATATNRLTEGPARPALSPKIIR